MARKLNRIDNVLAVVKEVWEKHPDLRLGQLLLNLTGDIAPRLYYAEDDAIVAALIETYSNATSTA